LIEAFLLVFLVVYLLQDFKFILLYNKYQIIGTFSSCKYIWFLDQHADVICHDSGTGIVVDDAIVVVEAVHAKLDEGAKSAKEATLSAMMKSRSNYLDYTCNVMVFIPVSFCGPAGSYQQFAVTLAIAF
jgi:HAE1 family hydrophobic/amphiphilic exporter-1